MENINALYKALEQADATGDTKTAQSLADQIRLLSPEDTADEPATDVDSLYSLLENADATGDKASAQKIADQIRALTPEEVPTEETPLVTKSQPKPEDVGFLARAGESLKQGVTSFGDIKRGYELGSAKDRGDLEAAALKMKEIKSEAGQQVTPTLTAADINRIAHEKGLLPAGAQVPSYIVEQVLKSGPQFAVPLLTSLLVGTGTAMVTGPAAPIAAPVAATIAGIGAYGLQQYGNFMSTQGLVNKAPEDLDPAKAREWAAYTAPLGFLVDKFVGGIGSKLGQKAMMSKVTQEIAKRKAAGEGVKAAVTKEIGKATVKGGVRGISEMPTEMLEQAAEIHQAGGDIFTEESKEQIFEAGWAGLAVGSGIGGSSNAYSKYKEFKTELQKEQEQSEQSDEDISKGRPSRETMIDETWKDLQSKATPIEPEVTTEPTTTLDKATLTSWGIKKGSIPFKTLEGVDASTPEGRYLVDKTLEAYTGKLNEQAVTTFTSLLDKKAEAPDAGIDLGTTTISDAVLGGSKYGTPGGTQGRFGPTTDISGSPVGVVEAGEEAGNAPLETTKPLEPQAVVTEAPVEEAPVEEAPVEEQPLTKELQEAKKLIGQLNTLDPGNELIQDLSELSVDKPTINRARQTVNQLLAARKAKVGKTLTPAEEADLTPDEFNIEDIKGTIEENQPDVVATTTKAKTLGQALNIIQTEHADKTSDAEKALINKLLNVPNLVRTKYQVDTINTAKNTTFRGTFNSLLNKVRVDKSIGNIKTILHEAVHSATVAALRKAVYTTYNVNKALKKSGLDPDVYTTTEHSGRTEAGKRMVKIYNTAYKAWSKTVFSKKPMEKPYGLKDVFEFTSEALSNPDFQKFLAGLPSIEGGKATVSSLWNDFVEGIKKLLNLGDISNTLLNDLISVVPELMQGPSESVFDRVKEVATSGESYVYAQRTPKSKLDDDLKKSGTVAKEIEPEPTTFDRFKEAPIKTIDELVADFRKNFFSFDAALNNKILIAMRQQKVPQKELAKSFYEMQVGQALHADHLADMWMVHGGIAYDPESFSFAIEDLANSMSTIRDELKELAKKYNVSEFEMYQYGNAAFVASRSQSLKKSNDDLKSKIRDLLVKGKKAEAAKATEKGFKLVHLTPAQIAYGMEFFKTIPELNNIKNTWNINRERLLKFAVDHGLYTEERAEELLDVIDFVPFYREQQAEANKVPKPFTRGLIDTAVDKRLKGSYRPVHNVFDNMERWSRYILKKSINNQAAQSKIKFYSKYIPDDIKIISGDSKTGNTVGVWYDGKVVKYEFQGFDGKSLVDGFTGLEPVVNFVVPKLVSKYAAFQRAQIVLEPLFNAAQITMDAYDALISSGIDYPILLPLQIVKEVLLSPVGLSKARTYLKKRGDVGKRDWASEYNTVDMEAMKQLKELKTSDKMIQAILSPVKYGIKGLKFLGMASDNIIRQALWSQVMLETGDVARATYVAREIINFRRTGSNAYISVSRQMAPFVNANLQASNIAFGTMLLSGITPDTKLTQFRRLITSGAQVAAAILILTALNSDDDDYKKLDPKDRDRLLIMPGSGGYALPVRGSIITAIFKNIPEHLYNRYIEESEDSEKLRKGLSEAFKRAIAMPTGFPTLFTPVLEQALNIDLVTGLPLRGQSQKDLEADLQYSNKYTSQLARLANDVTGVSPITVQNFMNRWLASTSMLISMFTNKLIGDIRGEILPEKTIKEMFLQLPSANKFITKQQNTRNLNDYYELNDIVSAVVDSANKYKDIDYDKFRAFQAKDNNAAIIDMRSELAIISRDLGNLRAYENKIYASKDTGRWTPQTKKQELDRIEQTRQTILGHQQAVQNKLDRRIQNLRSQAGL